MPNIKNHSHKVIDPYRFPKVSEKIDEEAKKTGNVMIGKTLVDLTKQMVKQVKNETRRN